MARQAALHSPVSRGRHRGGAGGPLRRGVRAADGLRVRWHPRLRGARRLRQRLHDRGRWNHVDGDRGETAAGAGVLCQEHWGRQDAALVCSRREITRGELRKRLPREPDAADARDRQHHAGQGRFPRSRASGSRRGRLVASRPVLRQPREWHCRAEQQVHADLLLPVAHREGARLPALPDHIARRDPFGCDVQCFLAAHERALVNSVDQLWRDSDRKAILPHVADPQRQRQARAVPLYQRRLQNWGLLLRSAAGCCAGELVHGGDGFLRAARPHQLLQTGVMRC
mmetsp:Transcript_81706/g.236886  ORF Transcript_81706/g.236886 Transcript_81706/m.236886 type:complete len:284 (-) Transcript_81706:4378-5229(-)